MDYIKKGTGERRGADDKEVREHPERFTSHGDDYRRELAAKARRARAEKKARDKRRK